jgi:hypothetical protein
MLFEFDLGPRDVNIPSFRKVSDLRIPSKDLVNAEEQKNGDHRKSLTRPERWFCGHCVRRIGMGQDEVSSHLKYAYVSM